MLYYASMYSQCLVWLCLLCPCMFTFLLPLFTLVLIAGIVIIISLPTDLTIFIRLKSPSTLVNWTESVRICLEATDRRHKYCLSRSTILIKIYLQQAFWKSFWRIIISFYHTTASLMASLVSELFQLSHLIRTKKISTRDYIFIWPGQALNTSVINIFKASWWSINSKFWPHFLHDY